MKIFKEKTINALNISTMVLSAVILSICIMTIFFMPDQIAIHFDLQGNANRFASQYELLWLGVALYIFPVIMAIVFIKCNTNALNKMIGAIGSLVVAITFLIMTISIIVMIVQASGTIKLTSSVPIVMVVIGCVIFISANVLPLIPRNSIIGVRTQKSLSSDSMWKKINTLSALVLLLMSVVIFISTLLLENLYALIPSLLGIVCGLIAIYFINKKLKLVETSESEIDELN